METHVVRQGESLSRIAKKYGCMLRTLTLYNEIRDPNRLTVGQRLQVPTLKPREPARPKAEEKKNTVESHAFGLTEAELRFIMASTASDAVAFLHPIEVAMKACSIVTPEQQAAFLAQVCVESGHLHSTEENLNYSAQRLHQVWRKRFPNIAEALPYAHNGQKLGNHVYANRLGNGDEASGDGYRFRGRGLIQVTGRAGYRDIGFESDPEALARPGVAAMSATKYWQSRGLNERSRNRLTRGQFDAITLSVNGGSNGCVDRWLAYKKALKVLSSASAGS